MPVTNSSPYYISTIEMELLWEDIKCLEIAETSFLRKINWPFFRAFKWSTKHPCSLRCCKASRRQSWKYEKIKDRSVKIGPSGKFFLLPPTLTFRSFEVPWATTMHSISFESPDIGAIWFKLKIFFLHSKNPHFNSVYLEMVPFLSDFAGPSWHGWYATRQFRSTGGCHPSL